MPMLLDKFIAVMKRYIINPILEPFISVRRLESYLAIWARLTVKIRAPFVISVTGSVGKSTTTAMIAAVLSHRDAAALVGPTSFTVGNMNDDIGLPATLLRFGYGFEIPYSRRGRVALIFRIPFQALRAITGRYPRVMVLECGTDGRGNFARTVNIAPPHIAIVTTIGAAHLENLRTLAGVAQQKGMLVRAAAPSGLVILGLGHDHVAQLEQVARAPVVKVSGQGVELAQQITRAVCQHMGIPDEIVSVALRDFKSPAGRLNRLELTGMTVIDDTYNANPLSMKLGLDTLAKIAAPAQRRLAILGVMAELGAEGPVYHEELGRYARARADILVGVGQLAKSYSPDFWFLTSDACADSIEGLLSEGDCLLVKGSASARMDRVVKRLQEIAEKRVGIA